MSGTEGENAAKLARMAGQILAFYRSYPNDEAVAGITTHINTFWTPRMREEFLAAYGEGDSRLDPLLRAARAGIRRASPPGQRA